MKKLIVAILALIVSGCALHFGTSVNYMAGSTHNDTCYLDGGK